MSLEPLDHGRLARDILEDLNRSQSSLWTYHKQGTRVAFFLGALTGASLTVIAFSLALWIAR